MNLFLRLKDNDGNDSGAVFMPQLVKALESSTGENNVQLLIDGEWVTVKNLSLDNALAQIEKFMDDELKEGEARFQEHAAAQEQRSTAMMERMMQVFQQQLSEALEKIGAARVAAPVEDKKNDAPEAKGDRPNDRRPLGGRLPSRREKMLADDAAAKALREGKSDQQ